MIDLRKTESAKKWIDKLSVGINPIDGSALPEGDTVRDEHISNCFKYVSKVLEEALKEIIIRRKASKSIPSPFRMKSLIILCFLKVICLLPILFVSLMSLRFWKTAIESKYIYSSAFDR